MLKKSKLCGKDVYKRQAVLCGAASLLYSAVVVRIVARVGHAAAAGVGARICRGAAAGQRQRQGERRQADGPYLLSVHPILLLPL